MTHEIYTIGKFYNVPTVHGLFGYRTDNWPVLGPKHKDAEYIGFPKLHYHLDYRFFNATQWQSILDYSGVPDMRPLAYIYGVVLQDTSGFTELGPVTIRRRKCHRIMPDYAINAWWLPALSAAYANKTLVDGHICPHRGASLRGLPVDADGCVTCVLHGLKWNIETKKLVTA